MKIACLVSGGVDSSVALRLLKDEGHDITAFYLKIWLEDELSYLGDCPWQEDLSYVEAVCKQANVPLKVLNLQKEYFDLVVKYAIKEVEAGRTPNPDMFCNFRVKFGAFYNAIDDSFDKIATGHYADIEEKDGVFYLKRVPDQIKDQTYFLAHLTQKQLSKALFPIGRYKKTEVRELAKKYDLPNKDRKDSQGICFLGKIKYNDFLKHYFGEKPGDIIDVKTKKKVGTHKGYYYHTLGQRKGMGLGHGPWYVVSKDPQKNIVYISNEYKDVPRNEFYVNELNLPSGPLPKEHLKVKVRHGQQVYRATVSEVKNGIYKVHIEGQDQGLAPGQFCVFYDDVYCYGCATIIDYED
ncbi:MAG TPA: tRNA 2-thiouridine(34) synthase MnmA [Acidobacteriota bacterium]|nr:tRNA 2-thiouridine(34) synthase MnmA [Acidobacteriota bacterium]